MDPQASIWEYDPAMASHLLPDLAGFEVAATDGCVGTITESSERAGSCYVVVDTGRWIGGEQRLIPAGLVRLVNEHERTVHVALSKTAIRWAPDFRDGDRDEPDLAYDAYYGRYGCRRG
jgi:hypothetical protein